MSTMAASMYRVEDAKVRDFYSPFYGHDVKDLSVALAAMRRRHDRVVWLAGDSSLDNKYWFEDVASALNGYEDFLTPQVMKKDVCYWINERCVAENKSMGCINTAVEATCLNDRAFGRLLPQDAFLRDNMAEEDVLVVSVGGNDVALQPLLCTALNLAALVCCTPAWCLERCACARPPNLGVDCGCVGCGLPGCVVGTCSGWPLGFGYVVDLFKNRVESYVRRLCATTKPRTVLVCAIYYPEETTRGGWADTALKAMCYDFNPGKLQLLIRKVFEHATARIRVPGVNVVPVPLFEVLDSKDPRDYEQRVEPSASAGSKMAAAFHAAMDRRDTFT